jgi:sigma-E factor negative regulatory protein RseC
VLSNKEVLIEVVNDLQANIGDHVEISVPTGSLLKLSLLVYIFPIIALIVGAVLGGAWAQSFGLPSTLASILGGGFAMGITFYILKRIDRIERVKGEYQPRITRILP